MRESHIEQRVCQVARDHGWMALKLNVVGLIGFPDRMLLRPGGQVMFIEFKARGKEPRASQVRVIEKLREFGFRVEVIDNIEEGERLVTC